MVACPSSLPHLHPACFHRSFHPLELLLGIRSLYFPLGVNTILSIVEGWEKMGGREKEKLEGKSQREGEEGGGNVVGGVERNVFTLCHS